MLGTSPHRATIGLSVYIDIELYIDLGPRLPHPTTPKTRLGPIPCMTMTGLPCLGVLVRIVCCVTILMLSSTCVLVVLTGIEVSRAFRGAHPFHPSSWSSLLPAATVLARLDQCYHWRRLNEKMDDPSRER